MPWASIAGGVISGIIQSDATSQAAQTQRDAAARATEEQARQYNLARADQAPWRQVGASALMRLAGGSGVGASGGLPAGYGSIGSSYSANDPAALRAEIQARMMQNAPANNSRIVNTAEGSFVENDPAVAQWQAQLPGMVEQEFNREMAARSSATNGRSFTDQNMVAAPGGAGGGGTNDLTRRFTLADLESDPVYQQSYQAGLDMGLKRLSASLGAAGTLNSGGAAKAMARYASDYNSQKAGDAFNRFQVQQGNEFNRLASLAGIGQTATNQTQAAGQNMANNVSGIQQNLGNNIGASQIAQGNLWGGTVQGIGNWYSNQNNFNRLMDERARDRAAYGNTSYSAPTSNGGSGWEQNWGIG